MSTQTTTTEAASGAEGLERVRHLKRGTEYEVLGEAEAQVATGHRDINDMTYTDIQDGSRLTVYRCLKTGKLWARLVDEFRDGRFETIAAAPVTGTEGERSWLPMKDAPTGVPIIAKHKPNARMPLGWVGTITLGHGDEEESGALDAILHYNGDALIYNFHGCWEGWLPFGSAIPATAPQPAGAERVDLGELAEEIAQVIYQTHPDISFAGDGAHVVKWHQAAEIRRVRSRKAAERILSLVPASLSAALGRGEGTAGACPMGSDLRPSDHLLSGLGGDAVPKPSRKLCPSCHGARGGLIGESGGSPDWDDCWTCGGEGFVTERQGAHPAFDKARTSSDPYDDRDGPWYDMKRVRQIEKETGIAFVAPCDESGEAGETHSGLTEGDSAVGVAEAPHPQSPSLSEVEEAKAVLNKYNAPESFAKFYRSMARLENDPAVKAGWHKSADAIEAALATITASQEQDGEVRT